MGVPATPIWRQALNAAEHTPPGRDRVVDLLRGGSLAVVVVGHILMAVVVWDDGTPAVANLLGELPHLQPLTWVFQVMPLFFAAGAIANRGSWQSAQRGGTTWAQWYWARTRRLLRPVIWYLAAWIPLVLIGEAAMGSAAKPLAALSTQLLWFLAVYLAVVALTPLETVLAQHGPSAVAGLFAAAVAVDAARFHVAAAAGLANFLIVWVLAAVCGLVIRDHIDAPRTLAAVAALFAAVNVAAVAFGPYPLSLVGMPGEDVSNMAPPTLLLAGHTVAVICAVGALWRPLERLCERRRVWQATCVTGAVAMTLYLWHLTALIVVVVAQHALGLDRPAVDSPSFWAATALYVAVALGAVIAVVAVAAPLEYLPVPWFETPAGAALPHTAALGGLGAALLAVGILALAGTGMYGFPFSHTTNIAGIPVTPGVALIVAAAGALAVRAAGRATS